jgi:hypothetical protein
LVLSPATYNGKVGLALLCPITSRVKNFPFEVALPEGLPVSGVISRRLAGGFAAPARSVQKRWMRIATAPAAGAPAARLRRSP